MKVENVNEMRRKEYVVANSGMYIDRKSIQMKEGKIFLIACTFCMFLNERNIRWQRIRDEKF